MKQLPSDWRWVELGNVLTGIEAGKSFKAEQRPALPDEKGVLKISSLTWGKFQSRENKALLPDANVDGVPTVQAGDLLISRANTVELVGAVAMADKAYPHLLLSDKTLRLKPDSDAAHSRFLLYVLRTPEARQHIESHATGTSGSMRNITQVNIRKTPIPLPPIAEQRRIAAILDKADGVRRKRKEAIALTEELLRSVFLDMFGDPVTNPKGWEILSLKELTNRITYGFTSPMKHLENGIPILTAKNVLEGRIRFDNAHFADRNEFNALTDKSKPNKGDILVTKDGSIGRCAIVEDERPLCINQSVALVQPKHSDIDVNYLLGYLTSNSIQSQMTRMGKGNAIKHLQITELAKYSVPVPPQSMQVHYSNIRKINSKHLLEYQRSLSETDNLFKSLLQRAFRGEL